MNKSRISKTRSKKVASKSKASAKKATKVVEELILRETDIVCGRGSGVTNWDGNLGFRYLCFKVKPVYVKADRMGKANFAKELIKEIATLNPPGRFVELIEGTEIEDRRCVLVPIAQAIEKTCQALREKKNGCPRPFKALTASTKTKQSVNTPTLMFSDERINKLCNALDKQFSVDTNGKSAGTDSTCTKPRSAAPREEVEADVEIKKSTRLTARQAVIESIMEAKQLPDETVKHQIIMPTPKKRKVPEIVVVSPPIKKPKVCPETPAKAFEQVLPDIAVSAPEGRKKVISAVAKVATKTTKLEMMPSLMVLEDTFKPIERPTTPVITKDLVSSALVFQTRSISASHLDQEMALLPPTMTAFCSGIFTNMVSPAMTLESPQPRRHPSKAPRKSHNMLPLDFPTLQPIQFDEKELMALEPTPLKSVITQGSNVPSMVLEEALTPTTLAAYMSDFFNKKYFPVSTTSRYFSGPDCNIAPLPTTLVSSTSQSPTTVFDNFFVDDSSIVSYNQPLFDDDLEVFPDI